MDIEIPILEIPGDVEISKKLTYEEQPRILEHDNPHNTTNDDAPGPSFHEKKEKNKKVNLGGSYQRTIKKKYKKPKTKGDKNYNKRNKRK